MPTINSLQTATRRVGRSSRQSGTKKMRTPSRSCSSTFLGCCTLSKYLRGLIDWYHLDDSHMSLSHEFLPNNLGFLVLFTIPHLLLLRSSMIRWRETEVARWMKNLCVQLWLRMKGFLRTQGSVSTDLNDLQDRSELNLTLIRNLHMHGI